jgi:hypothetical protein
MLGSSFGGVAFLLGTVLSVKAIPVPPTMPTQFSVHVVLNESDGLQVYDWHFDSISGKEQMVWSYPENTSSVLIYHNNSIDCEDNTCCTIYSWEPSDPAGSCYASNTSNTQDALWGWLTDDEFTHQKATFLRKDTAATPACNLWQHNSRPVYPEQMNETACIGEGLVPVYSNWTDGSDEFEHQTFKGFKLAPSGAFPAGTFEPPKNCAHTNTALAARRTSYHQQQSKKLRAMRRLKSSSL